jgi:hypothetical protein
MSEAATLMFGLGATRAGSTWLYRYLAGHPECALPRVKELHYFSTLDLGGRQRQLKRLDKIAARAVERGQRAETDARRRASAYWRQDADGLRALIARDEDVPAYLSYLRDGREGRLHGDITPAYALLSAERLSMMARLTDRVRFVLLLRDPVDRLWSNICQTARFKADRGAGKQATTARVEAVTGKMFDRWLAGEEHQLSIRCDYAGILSRIGKAIDPSQLFVTFYERLFRNSTIAALCRFLGLSEHEADFERRSNASDKIDMKPVQRAKAQAELRAQYDFIDSYMGGDLPARWTQNRTSAPAGEMRV